MTSPPPDSSDSSSLDEAPGVPGFPTWRRVYLVTFGWFVIVVALLAVFSRVFS